MCSLTRQQIIVRNAIMATRSLAVKLLSARSTVYAYRSPKCPASPSVGSHATYAPVLLVGVRHCGTNVLVAEQLLHGVDVVTPASRCVAKECPNVWVVTSLVSPAFRAYRVLASCPCAPRRHKAGGSYRLVPAA